jgi:hypothetical protein
VDKQVEGLQLAVSEAHEGCKGEILPKDHFYVETDKKWSPDKACNPV